MTFAQKKLERTTIPTPECSTSRTGERNELTLHKKWNKQSQPGQEYGGRDGLSRSGWIFLVQAIAIGLLGLQISSHCGDFEDF